ncbi:hypothetical protein [Pseudomonas triclosanedens]|jgi:hypothetical protein|uniref:hypothetical protein n=1 Tax=Pseudomonas triclosanedens TaxID=2961893 RepID=UPI0020C48F71|nr:hypothetical protein [Pseudomonas triclosanedens]ELR2940606.1 hypothetical protein [Pseudomonas aeruginosa]MCP8473795.1 hypothetical protein [Pseudomonas triclosanedens]
MRSILARVCSVKEICTECRFRKTTTDPERIKERREHIACLKTDILHRVPCRSDQTEYEDGDQPFCRGAAVYMVKKGMKNALLKAAIEEGFMREDDLKREADLVVD